MQDEKASSLGQTCSWSNLPRNAQKKQGATGITTVAPYIAGQWGRGNNRLPG
jgi:hypothetical protein